jgi:hypothetical protein
MQSLNDLIGSWELQRYETWSGDGVAATPFGESPVGFAVFDAAGNAFIQLAQRPPDADTPFPETVSRRLADSFGAYFGPCDVDSAKSEITIRVLASNIVSYVGSVQKRPFVVTGDQLVLGVPGEYRATLKRASK